MIVYRFCAAPYAYVLHCIDRIHASLSWLHHYTRYVLDRSAIVLVMGGGEADWLFRERWKPSKSISLKKDHQTIFSTKKKEAGARPIEREAVGDHRWPKEAWTGLRGPTQAEVVS